MDYDGSGFSASNEEPKPEPTLGDELEKLRADVATLWLPFRWYLTRKLDRVITKLDDARDAAIRRYLNS